MRLRTKFLFLFWASGLFLLLQGLVAAFCLRIVGDDVNDLQDYTMSEDIAGQIKAELAQMPDVESLADPNQPVQLNRRQLTWHADRSLILCRSLRKLTGKKSSLDAIARIESAVAVYRSAGRAHSVAVEAGGGERVAKAAEDAFAELSRVQEEAVIEPVSQEARLATKTVIDKAETLNTGVTIGGVSLLVLTFIASIFMARATAHPFVRLVRAAREVGRGNLDTTVPVRSKDEVGELAQAFNAMTGQLREVYDGLEGEVRKRTEELRRREHDLERERRLAAIGRLASGVAHEVSNPLTVIASAAEGLRDRAQDDELQHVEAFEDFPDYLETIESEAYRLKRVVRRLLDFSRKGPTVMLPLDLRNLVADAVSLARLDPRAKEHPVLFLQEGQSTTIDDFEESGEEFSGPPLPVKGDADALKEALLNLLFNGLAAVHETREPGGGVTVRAGHEERKVYVEVTDTGVGVDPQDLERIFEPFFTTRQPGEGTGLGLSLVYGTMERHGGTVSCTSEGRGKGATFRLTLPWANPETPAYGTPLESIRQASTPRPEQDPSSPQEA